jgi:hypothetical protein
MVRSKRRYITEGGVLGESLCNCGCFFIARLIVTVLSAAVSRHTSVPFALRM